jgi:molybdopterin-guanine dinucleotide biosynthesis protein A
MGGADKAFLKLGGETLIERAIARAAPQVNELVINANGDLSRFMEFGLPVIEDRVGGFLGPLAGILSGLDWVRANRPKARWLASFACDCPFFPRDLVERLTAKAESKKALVAVAASGERHPSGGRHHPVFAVWSTAIDATSESVLKVEGSRKMDDFIARFPNTRVEFPSDPLDPFFNINAPEDLKRAEALIAKG